MIQYPDFLNAAATKRLDRAAIANALQIARTIPKLELGQHQIRDTIRLIATTVEFIGRTINLTSAQESVLEFGCTIRAEIDGSWRLARRFINDDFDNLMTDTLETAEALIEEQEI